MPTSSTVQLVIEPLTPDASAVSRTIGLAPTAFGVADGSVPGSGGATWVYEISMPETESIEGQALALLRFLESHAEQIQQAAALYPASIAIAIEDAGEAGSIELGLVPLVASEISKLGLGIRIHFSSHTPAMHNQHDL